MDALAGAFEFGRFSFGLDAAGFELVLREVLAGAFWEGFSRSICGQSRSFLKETA